MQIIGVGSDIVECVRIAHMIDRHGQVFLSRVFTPHEICYCRSRKKSTEHFAARWAAKEAVLKCMGTGMSKGLCWTEIEVRNEPSGQPRVVVQGATRELVEGKRISEFMVSLSHCRNYATAYAVAVQHESDEG
jgi:holo-[acyl-carrier protein] synthase